MKISRKILALVLTLVMVTSLLGGVSAFAAGTAGENDAVKVSAVQTASGVDLIVTAKKPVASIEGAWSFDETAFAYSSVESDYDSPAVNGKLFSLAFSDEYTGEIMVVHFTKTASFVDTTEYTFGIKFNTCVDADDNSYIDNWSVDTVSATYQESVPSVTYTVTFDSNGGSAVASQNVAQNGKASVPVRPTRSGYKFDGWQLNGSDYDFNTPVTGNITLTAKWTEVANNAIDLSDTKISKTVIASEGVEVNETFTIKVTPQNGAPSIFSGDQVTITVTEAGTAVEQALDAVVFPKGGIYEYVIEEVAGESTDWSYDSTKYYLTIEIEPKDQDDTLTLGGVVIHKDSATGDKVTTLAFQNTYKPASKLIVTKTVEGEGDNPMFKDKEFSFTINFTAPAVSDGAITAKKIAADDTETDLGTVAYGTDFAFTLKNGEQVVFDNVAEGTNYALTETGTEYYTASAVVTSGGTQGAKQEGTYATDFSVTGKTADGENKVAVTNTYSITPPTGILMHSELLIIAAFAVVALAGIFFISRKLRKNED